MTYLNGGSVNGTAIERERPRYDRNRNIHDIVRDHARLNPAATAIACDDRTISFAELDRMTDALAAHLGRHGVGKGDVVALFLGRSVEAVIGMLATVKAGGAYLPIDPAYPAEHLDYVIGECRPKVVFVNSDLRDTAAAVPSLSGHIIDITALLASLSVDPSYRAPEVGGGDPAYVMYTSGSTGRPKGVVVPHRGISRIAFDRDQVDIRPDDVVLHTGTIAFDVTTIEIWGALLNGAKLAVMPDPTITFARISEVVQRHGVTKTFLATGIFHLFADFGAGHLPSLRYVQTGGDVLSAEHARRFLRAHPECQVWNAYGPTESTVFATSFRVPVDFEGHELPIGRPCAHTGVVILDDELNEVAAGVEGQLAITGDGLAIGYLNRPDLTEDKFRMVQTAEGIVRCYLTGDMAVKREDGMVLFKGRRDRQVKINGKRIELDEIEAALRRDQRLLDAAVICHQQGTAPKRIVAYICPRKAADLDDPEFPRVVMATLRTVLPPYMIPGATMVLKELPLTLAGKVERAKLPPPPAIATPVAAAPQSRSEEILIRLWKEALSMDSVPTNRNFFDVGGTSLQLLRVHAALEAELARPIDVFAFFKHPTIRELARFLDGQAGIDIRQKPGEQRSGMQRQPVSQFRRSTL
jgi:amino acid adenylation domain-containing protein